MEKRYKGTLRFAAVTLSFSLMAAGMAFAAETADADEAAQDLAVLQETSLEETQPEETSASDSAAALRSIGEDSENAIRLEITNKTGQAITYLNISEYDPDADPNAAVVRMQEALIEQGYLDDIADGLYGPNTKAAVIAFREAKDLSSEDLADKEMLTLLYGEYDDGNLLLEEETIAAEETVAVYYDLTQEEADDQETEDDKFLTIPEYTASFELEEGSAYRLHTLPMEENAVLSIYITDEFAYIEYQNEGSEEMISTYEAEKAIYDREHPVVTNTYTESYSYYEDSYYDYGGYDDYYYDPGYYQEDSYDWSYDAGYDDVQGAADGCIEDGLFW